MRTLKRIMLINPNNLLNQKGMVAIMENRCINCGKSLRNAPYTSPWEDGDNEEGYWICPSCHAKIIDWDSSDE
jgi:DNA-directed RNA polymerase subunit RPC12/RpoP